MKIVIVGSGSVGFHLAQLLSKENKNITLIDIDEALINKISKKLDIMTIHADGTSIKTLEQIGMKDTDLLIAVSTSEKNNLLSAILAKKLGCKKTIARIENDDNYEKFNRELYAELGVDLIVFPQKLVAQEILRLLQKATFSDLFDFENGILSLIGFVVENTCPLLNKPFGKIKESNKDIQFNCIAITRDNTTIIPTDDTILKLGDHFYLVTPKKSINDVAKLVGKQIKSIKNVMIIGDTLLALKTAQLLEKNYATKLVVKDENKSKEFIKHLEKTLVLHADPNDIDILKEEGLEKIDALLALTPNNETNIITSLIAQQLGAYKTIALVEDINYTQISFNIGIDTMVNIKYLAANNIFRYVRKGKIEALATIPGVDAEFLEIEVNKEGVLTQNPIKRLTLPDKTVFVGVIRGNFGYIPNENFRLQIDDKVIVMAKSDAINDLEELFK